MEKAITSEYPLIEAIKRSVITAFRRAVVSSFPDENLRKVENNVEMEYPFEEENYPGIWVRFSLNEVRRASLDPRFDDQDGNQYMMGFFKGKVTLEISALSSKERDGISSGLVNMVLFGRESEFANAFFETIEEIDYLAITIQDGVIQPGGQGETGIQSDEGRLSIVYTDSYSFNIIGQWASRYDSPTKLIRLKDIIVKPEMLVGKENYVAGELRFGDSIAPGTYV